MSKSKSQFALSRIESLMVIWSDYQMISLGLDLNFKMIPFEKEANRKFYNKLKTYGYHFTPPFEGS